MRVERRDVGFSALGTGREKMDAREEGRTRHVGETTHHPLEHGNRLVDGSSAMRGRSIPRTSES